MRVCVDCGSSSGANPIFVEAATALGTALAGAGIDLVYGGAKVGLMGAVADATLAGGGHVIGVMPEALVTAEVQHDGLSELRITADMHTRKATMAGLADGFVALPGGFGTWEEVCEVLTWGQLGMHAKPVVIFDVDGFYAPFFALVNRAIDAGFLKPNGRERAQRATTIAEVLAGLTTTAPAFEPKWIQPR